jgi:Uma2 family endonuclease
MQQVRPRMSYADLERLPDDGRRYELYDGVLVEMPSPTLRHQRVGLKIAVLLEEYEHACGGLTVPAPFDIVLTPYDVVQPDVVFFEARRVPGLDMRGPARVPPDLAVEVLSPGTEKNDRGRKMRLLARHGISEYWLVDPIGQTIERYVLEAEAYVLDGVVSADDEIESRALAGLRAPAARVFDA